MEASTGPPRLPSSPTEPNTEKIKQRLLREGVTPTPKIIHTLRKKELQKLNRRQSKLAAKQPSPILTECQKQTLAEESHLATIKSEYKKFTRAINGDKKTVGRPWERLEKIVLREFASGDKEQRVGKLKKEHLLELSDYMENEKERLMWLFKDDVEEEPGLLENETSNWMPPQNRRRSEAEAIRLFVDRLSERELSLKDWKFTKIMRHSGLQYTEKQMLKILDGLGSRGQWKQALSVVEWVYNSKENRQWKSRFVYTKLLALLGKARRPSEALKLFNFMRGDVYLYPDMASYHSLAVALGQAGLLKELVNVIEFLKKKPKKVKNIQHPELQPDVVIFNAVLNACVPSRQWRGVSWVFEQLRKLGLQPNGATYGLAMEVMLASRKYDLVHEFFGKMRRSGESLRALTYKVLVKSFWEEGKVDEAVEAVRDMEVRGIKGTASVYYELACCLCYHGRCQEAIMEVEKLKRVRPCRPLEVTFTGMILAALEGGHINDCLCIYGHCKENCKPDIGLVNAMLKVYGQNDMFLKAKELFEEIRGERKDGNGDTSPLLVPDMYTFRSMLQLSAKAQQWEYFEYVYGDMVFFGHQLEQNKHASLFVEASRAGKLHLLEHAFDSTLEAGEVPHFSFFTELIFQAAIQHDHAKAARILKAMSLAPFQVSEKHWIEIFQENRDLINVTGLRHLSESLSGDELSTEATSLNFIRAIQSFCILCSSSDTSDSGGTEGLAKRRLPTASCDGASRGDAHAKSLEVPASTGDINFANRKNAIRPREEDSDREFVSELSSQDESATPHVISELSSNHAGVKTNISSLLKYTSFLEDEYIDVDEDGMEIEDSVHFTDDYDEPDVPSAVEILELWKEMRKSDSL